MLIVDSLELLALVLFAIAAACALWSIHPALGFAGAAAVVAAAAWWLGRPRKSQDPNQ
ncbi:hypothetical protein [Amycolatopsis speibonae]|uniref:Uncharacterized protein n=1 Tax=Amycolatopsis speibonae TaxID=1450224 RepID=A0ABV7P4K0_9PSEU